MEQNVRLKITGTTVHGHLHDGSGEHSALLRCGVSSRREAGGGLEPGPLL